MEFVKLATDVDRFGGAGRAEERQDDCGKAIDSPKWQDASAAAISFDKPARQRGGDLAANFGTLGFILRTEKRGQEWLRDFDSRFHRRDIVAWRFSGCQVAVALKQIGALAAPGDHLGKMTGAAIQ